MDGTSQVWSSGEKHVGESVWVFSTKNEDDEPWMKGTIRKVTSGTLLIELISSGNVVEVDLTEQGTIKSPDSVVPRDVAEEARGVQNMDNMTHLHEASVLQNVCTRFAQKKIYTRTGPILVAMNPFEWLDIYNSSFLTKYCVPVNLVNSLEPHCFAEAQRAHENEGSQSLIICGESGSGKTETTKLMLKFLSKNFAGNGRDKIESRIMMSNPLLEAFGNAKTLRNSNSSRFGKFIRLGFSEGRLEAAQLKTYLLEKSRTVSQEKNERNYHIFYQVFSGVEDSQRKELGLNGKTIKNFFYLNQSHCVSVEGVDDCSDFMRTMEAMDAVEIAKSQQDGIVSLIAAILHLGNVKFQNEREEAKEAIEDDSLNWSARLLGCESTSLAHALTVKFVKVRNQCIEKSLSTDHAADLRDALAKTVYSKLFAFIVHLINNSLDGKGDMEDLKCIGILDIFGFESFQQNGFEQLLINYANEMLQNVFNEEIFRAEELMYKEEGIPFSRMDFPDNRPCLELFKSIFSSMHDECLRFSAGSLDTMVGQINQQCKTHSHFSPCGPGTKWRKLSAKRCFAVKHFAGEIVYNVDGFLEKNRDTLHRHVGELLSKSNSTFVSNLFDDFRVQDISNKGKLQTTVAKKFEKQVENLMQTIRETKPIFVRCIKSNGHLKPGQVDRASVLRQLKHGGVIAALEMKRAGYPSRMKYKEFAHRCQLLLVDFKFKSNAWKEAARQVFQHRSLSHLVAEVAFGKSQLFMRASVLHSVDLVIREKLNRKIVIAQGVVRQYLCAKKFLLKKLVATNLQRLFRGDVAREKVKTEMQELFHRREWSERQNLFNTLSHQVTFRDQRLESKASEIEESLARQKDLNEADRLLSEFKMTISETLRENALQNELEDRVQNLRNRYHQVQLQESSLKRILNQEDETEDEFREVMILITGENFSSVREPISKQLEDCEALVLKREFDNVANVLRDLEKRIEDSSRILSRASDFYDSLREKGLQLKQQAEALYSGLEILTRRIHRLPEELKPDFEEKLNPISQDLDYVVLNLERRPWTAEEMSARVLASRERSQQIGEEIKAVEDNLSRWEDAVRENRQKLQALSQMKALQDANITAELSSAEYDFLSSTGELAKSKSKTSKLLENIGSEIVRTIGEPANLETLVMRYEKSVEVYLSETSESVKRIVQARTLKQESQLRLASFLEEYQDIQDSIIAQNLTNDFDIQDVLASLKPLIRELVETLDSWEYSCIPKEDELALVPERLHVLEELLSAARDLVSDRLSKEKTRKAQVTAIRERVDYINSKLGCLNAKLAFNEVFQTLSFRNLARAHKCSAQVCQLASDLLKQLHKVENLLQKANGESTEQDPVTDRYVRAERALVFVEHAETLFKSAEETFSKLLVARNRDLMELSQLKEQCRMQEHELHRAQALANAFGIQLFSSIVRAHQIAAENLSRMNHGLEYVMGQDEENTYSRERIADEDSLEVRIFVKGDPFGILRNAAKVAATSISSLFDEIEKARAQHEMTVEIIRRQNSEVEEAARREQAALRTLQQNVQRTRREVESRLRKPRIILKTLNEVGEVPNPTFAELRMLNDAVNEIEIALGRGACQTALELTDIVETKSMALASGLAEGEPIEGERDEMNASLNVCEAYYRTILAEMRLELHTVPNALGMKWRLHLEEAKAAIQNAQEKLDEIADLPAFSVSFLHQLDDEVIEDIPMKHKKSKVLEARAAVNLAEELCHKLDNRFHSSLEKHEEQEKKRVHIKRMVTRCVLKEDI